MLYCFGPYSLDMDLPLLMREGVVVSVPPRALDLLVLLIDRRDTAVAKRELMDALWPNAFVEEGSLTQLISVLRKALADDFPDTSPIQTISKVGYRFRATVIATEHPPTSLRAPESLRPAPHIASLPPEAPAKPSQPPRHRPLLQISRTLRLFAIAGCVCLALMLLLLLATPWSRRHDILNRAQAARPRATLAVLPFQNLAASPDSAWVGSAVQEMLSTDLRLTQRLRVLSTEDVDRALKETNIIATADLAVPTLRHLGDDLDCGYTLTGAYLLRAGRLRLDVRIINLKTGATEQEQTFERSEADLLPMLTQVRQLVAESLGGQQSPQDRQLASLATGVNPAAFQLYSEGLERTRRYDGKGAIEILERAKQMDPDYPLIHLALSTAWTERGEESKAAAEADRALQLAGSLPREEQLTIQARAQSAKHQFAAAAQTYAALVSFFPDNPQYGRLLVQALSSAGQSSEALTQAKALLATFGNRPPDPMTDSVIADLYSTKGDWSKALEWSEKGIAESRRRGAPILYERLLTSASQANFYLQRYAPAESQTREALDLAARYDDVSGRLRALNRMGQIATAQHDWALAKSSLNDAIAIEQKLDQPQRQVHTLLTLSRLEEQQGDLPRASLAARQALQLAGTLGFAETATEARLQLAILTGKSGDRALALRQLADVEADADRIQDAYLKAQARSAREALHGSGKPRSAL